MFCGCTADSPLRESPGEAPPHPHSVVTNEHILQGRPAMHVSDGPPANHDQLIGEMNGSGGICTEVETLAR